MAILKFKFPEIPKQEIDDTYKFLNSIFTEVKKQFVNESTFERIISKNETYSSEQLKTGQKPEELVKEFIVRKILKYLGYTIRTETKVRSINGLRWADYLAINPETNSVMFYVEVESFNTDLFAENKGLEQIKPLLLSKMASTEYGIATDGLKWILVKYDEGNIKEILKFNLHSVAYSIYNKKLDNQERKEIETLLLLKIENFETITNNYLIIAEESKKEISKRFYSEYIRYVFGKDENGNNISGSSLLSSIIPPPSKDQRELFALITMNRLMFIAFLQDKNVVPKNLLKNLYEQYISHANQPLTFYKSFLSPLFYEVFNKEKNERTKEDYNNIPYLNGGLFRENIPDEKEYDIKDDGMFLVLKNLIFKYKIGLSGDSELRPEILGYIFEKTVNYISESGIEQRKAEGAYYTPDDVVNFIIEKTLSPIIFNKMMSVLRKAGWRESDLEGYSDLKDLMENLPENPKYLKAMENEIKNIKIIDPACGSGHFLVAVTNFLVRIHYSLLTKMGETPNLYEITREIISNNIYGVDINEIAVEISKLRLWLSVIAEIKDNNVNVSNISTLPNIDFNIITGNTLIGQLNEPLGITFDHEITENKEIMNKISTLKNSEELYNKLEMGKNKIEEVYDAYHRILNEYKLSSGAQAKDLHNFLMFLRSKIYDIANRKFLSYYLSKLLKTRKSNKNSKFELILNKPLHWNFDFYDILSNGGFDAVVGNPPYVEDNNYSEEDLKIINLEIKKNRSPPLKIYYSNKSGNTYAYFIERSLNILRYGGRLGFIVPISLVSTDRMKYIRNIIHQNSSEVTYYNFDDRPGKLFYEGDHGKNTILILEKGEARNQINTSSCVRWQSEKRSELFDKLNTFEIDLNDTDILFFRNIIPKISNEIEYKILRKLKEKSHGHFIKDYIDTDKCTKIYCYDTCRYYIHAHTEENYKLIGDSKYYIPICVSSDYHKLIVAILNSSLFYWWFRVWSDERHVLIDHIINFPIDLSAFINKLKEINVLLESLMSSYIEKAVIRKNKRKGGYEIEIKEIHPKYSQDILDKIDNLIMDVLGFNDSEKSFILNYERSFRLSDEN
jgi:hypothetical protein